MVLRSRSISSSLNGVFIQGILPLCSFNSRGGGMVGGGGEATTATIHSCSLWSLMGHQSASLSQFFVSRADVFTYGLVTPDFSGLDWLDANRTCGVVFR